jgi:hypothetical protein
MPYCFEKLQTEYCDFTVFSVFIFIFLPVSVTHIEWFDEEKEFAIAFIDGVVKLGRKNPNFQPISLSAHQVS